MNLRLSTAMILLLCLVGCAGSGKLASSTTSAPTADARSILTAADASRADGRFTEAIQIYQEALVGDAKLVAAQYGIAECLLGLGKVNEAAPIFAALTKDPDYRARGLQGVGLVDLARHRHEHAVQSLQQATAMDPKLWRAWNGLGLLADRGHNPQEAQDMYRRAIAIDPDSAILHNNLGYSLLLAGKAGEAVEELRKAMNLAQDNEAIQNNYRIALASEGRYADALRGVVSNRIAEVLNNVGYVAMQRGDLPSAEKYLALAMEQSPSFDAVASQNAERLKSLRAGDK